MGRMGSLSLLLVALLMGGCACPGGDASCGGRCVDLDTDPSSCGACGVLCLSPASCVAGRCECDGAFCDGICAATASDSMNCGACGQVCAEGAACVSGACACPDGTSECDGACVDRLTDPMSCGECGVSCGAEQSCVGGECRCDAGGLAACGVECVDLASDLRHCGGCDAACPAGASCAAGRCECPSPAVACGDVCARLDSDLDHCGVCFGACSAPTSCLAGACACPDGGEVCGSFCADTSTDPSNCGACGGRCGVSESCASGRCVPGYRWHDTHRVGGTMTVRAQWDGRVAVAGTGHIYLAYSAPSSSVVLVRYHPDGTVDWTRYFSTWAVRVGAIAADATGRVALTATYDGSWASPGRSTHWAGGSSSNVATALLDPSGTVLWDHFVDSPGADHAGGVAIAPGGEIVVAGTLGASYDFGGGERFVDLDRDAFLLTLDGATGAYRSARDYGGRGTEEPVYVSVAPDGDRVLAGRSGAGVDLGGGATSTVTGGFVGRVGADFAHRWSRRLPGGVYGVTTNAAGDVFVLGHVSVSTTYDFGGGVSLTVPSRETASYVVALDGATGDARWVRGVFGGDDFGRGPVVDDRGNVWAGTTTWGSLGSGDAVLTGWTASGTRFYQRSFGSSRADHACGLATAGDTLVFAGRFQGDAVFGSEVVTASDRDVFVLAFDI